MQLQEPEGIRLLRELLKPENRAKLVASDEKHIIDDLTNCCDTHPGCQHTIECKKLHSSALDYIPFVRERLSHPRKYETEEMRYASTIPVLSRGAIKQSIQQKQERYLYL